MIQKMLKLSDHTGRGRPLMGSHRVGLNLIGRRRSRRLEVEAAEVAEVDRWLADMRNQPEMVLYPAHATSTTPAHRAPTKRARGKKRRR